MPTALRPRSRSSTIRCSRPRYGFVSHYEAGRATDGVAENVRRFHLNAVQFYDWMYRHAKLMPPEEEFEDALGQRISLATVRRLVAAVHEAGSLPIAYAAVYAVGKEAWPEWEATASSGATARRGCSATSSGTSIRRANAGWRISRRTCGARWRSGSPAFISTNTARRSGRCGATAPASISSRRSRR